MNVKKSARKISPKANVKAKVVAKSIPYVAVREVVVANAPKGLLMVGIAMMGLSMPAIIIGNLLTFILVVVGMAVTFSDPRIRSQSAVNQTLNALRYSRFVWLIAVALLVLYIGTFKAIIPNYAAHHWSVVVAVIGCGGLLSHVFRQFELVERDAFLKWLMWSVQASFIIALVIAIAEPWAYPGLYGEKPWTQTHLRYFSSVLAVILPLCWMVWLKPDGQGRFDVNSKAYKQGLLWVGLSLVMVLLCAGRAGWLGVGAGVIVWMAMMVRYHQFKLPPFGKLAILVAGLMVTSGVGYMVLYGKKSIEERIGVTIPTQGLGGGRLEIWQLALKHVFDQPWFGIGVNNFRFIPGADYHPHNFVIQLWLEGGLIGLGLCMALLAWLGWTLFQRGKRNIVATSGLAAFTGFVISALTNKSIFNPEWLVILVIVITFVLAQSRGKAAPETVIRKKGR